MAQSVMLVRSLGISRSIPTILASIPSVLVVDALSSSSKEVRKGARDIAFSLKMKKNQNRKSSLYSRILLVQSSARYSWNMTELKLKALSQILKKCHICLRMISPMSSSTSMANSHSPLTLLSSTQIVREPTIVKN